jgi:hypothetical protein
MSQTEFFNYVPHRKVGSKGIIRVSTDPDFIGDYPVTIDIPKYTEFSNGTTSFVSTTSRILSPGQDYIDIDVIQGVPKSKQYEITSAQFPDGTDYVELILDNDSIENTMYDVSVNGITWSNVEHIRLAVDGEDQVYVIKNAIDMSGIVLQFGNDVFGKKLSIGDIVTLEFVETKGENGNILSANNVTTILGDFIDSNSQPVDLYCKNTDIIVGGTDYESIEAIRVNAPRSYQTGDRAMTRQDYETIIKELELLQE